jgi:hypothetical protein
MNRAVVAPLGLAFALACGTPSPGDEEVGDDTTGDSEESGTDATDGTEDATGDGTTTDTGVEPLATVSGVVTDMQGAALGMAGIQLCGPIDDMGTVESCIPVQVDDASGEFTVGATKLGLYALKCVHAPQDARYFTGQSFQLTLAEGDELDYSQPPIVIPETDTVTDLTGMSGTIDVEIDDVLTISIDPALAQTPDFIAPTSIGGLQVDAEFWRVTEVEGAPVIAAWSFAPFGTHATEGSFGFSIASNLGLGTGEAVNFYGVQKDNGVIHHVGTGTVNGDATAIDIVPTVEGLHELAWLLVTQ